MGLYQPIYWHSYNHHSHHNPVENSIKPATTSQYKKGRQGVNWTLLSGFQSHQDCHQLHMVCPRKQTPPRKSRAVVGEVACLWWDGVYPSLFFFVPTKIITLINGMVIYHDLPTCFCVWRTPISLGSCVVNRNQNGWPCMHIICTYIYIYTHNYIYRHRRTNQQMDDFRWCCGFWLRHFM